VDGSIRHNCQFEGDTYVPRLQHWFSAKHGGGAGVVDRCVRSSYVCRDHTVDTRTEEMCALELAAVSC